MLMIWEFWLDAGSVAGAVASSETKGRRREPEVDGTVLTVRRPSLSEMPGLVRIQKQSMPETRADQNGPALACASAHKLKNQSAVRPTANGQVPYVPEAGDGQLSVGCRIRYMI